MNVTTLENKPLKCLSIAQPWAWAIFNGKDFENRVWHSRGVAGPLLIHASRSLKYEDDMQWLVDHGHNPPPFASLYKGFIIGIVHHIGCWHISHLGACKVPRTHFAEGPYCHVYQHQTPFKNPIAYRGSLGMFDVPINDVRAELNLLPPNRKRGFRELYKHWCAN